MSSSRKQAIYAAKQAVGRNGKLPPAETRFPPGVSGNPAGRPPVPTSERAMRELARSYTPEALEVLAKIMRSAEDAGAR
jgi:hypothetical protein